MIQLRRSNIASALLIAFIAACGSETPTQVKPDTVIVVPPPPPPPPPVVGLVAVTAPARLVVGRTDVVRAVARTSAGVDVTGKTFTFVSSNPAAISVAADGTIRSVAPGTAVISVTTDGVTGTASIIASDPSLTVLTITPTSAPLFPGTTRQFTLAGKDSSGADVALRTVLWNSSNPAVATVSNTGLVTGRGLGTTTISAEAITVTAITVTATVTVSAVPVRSVAFASNDSVLRFRFPRALNATARDSIGGILNRPVTYTTSNVDIARLDDFGNAIATGEGTAIITASSEGRSATLRVFVPPDSGAYIVVAGGVPGDRAFAAIDIPGITFVTSSFATIPDDTLTRITLSASDGNYRARAHTQGDPFRVGFDLANYALLLGIAPAQPVTLGPPSTLFSVQVRPYAANIIAPANASANSLVTVSWTFDETTQPFSFYPERLPVGRLYFSEINGADLSGQFVNSTATRNANGTVLFSATFTAPAVPTQVFIQVAADGANAALLYPIKFRGQALRVINIVP